MTELKPLICQNCGGAINRQTMKCPYCDTQYEKKNNGITLNYVVEKPGTHRLRAEVRVAKEMREHNPERLTAYVLEKMRHEIADGLLAYMRITTSDDPANFCQIIRGEVKVIEPSWGDY